MKRLFLAVTQNTFLRNSLVLFMGTMVVNVLNYVFHLLIGRMVDPASYGEIESLISLLAIISVPAGTLTLVATKYAATLKATNNVKGTETLSSYLNHKVLIYGVPVFFCVILLTPLIKGFLNLDQNLPIIFLWIIMLLSFLSAITLGLLTGWQRFVDVNKVNITSTVLKLSGALLLVWFGFGVSGVLGGLVIAAIFGYLVSLLLLKKLEVKGDVEQQKNDDKEIPVTDSIKKYVFPAFYGTLAVAILGNADMVFAKHHLDAIASGEYGALSVVAKTIFFVTGVITTVLFAMSAEAKGRSQDTFRTFQIALGLTVIVSSLSVIFFFCFPNFVVSLLFGQKYVAVSSLLGWFALAAGIYSLGSLFIQYLLSLHNTRAAAYFLALSSLEIPILLFFGGGMYAIIGITIVTQILTVLLGIFFVLKQKRGYV